MNTLFRTKNPDHLIAEAATPERQMKRVLGPFALTCIGIGAIIGTGIFALAGTAAAGEQLAASVWKTPIMNFIQSWATDAPLVFGRPGAGPAVMLSFVVAAVACGFAALCYAELASMIPVSGSAYTYSYATLGEIIAWVIGWDLILEYAVGNMAVAVGWSGYFVQLCGSLFHLKFPLWLVNDERRRHCIFCVHRIRCSFDHSGGDEKSAARHADRNHREPDYLYAALRFDGGGPHRDEKIHNLFRRFGCGSNRVRRQALGAGTHQCRGARWTYFGATRFPIGPAADFHGHGARWAASRLLRENSSPISHPV